MRTLNGWMITTAFAAVIGFGSGMTSHALLGSPAIKHVVTIEIEPEMIKASRSFYPANARAYDPIRPPGASVEDASEL